MHKKETEQAHAHILLDSPQPSLQHPFSIKRHPYVPLGRTYKAFCSKQTLTPTIYFIDYMEMGIYNAKNINTRL